MDPRLRIGLIAGGGASLATLLLTITGSGICGPIFSIMAGMSAGMMVMRDPRFQANPVRAATIAGVYTGTCIGIAQLIGYVVFTSTPLGQTMLNQANQMTGVTLPSSSDLGLVVGCAGLLIGLIDLGIVIGAASVMAHYLMRRLPQPAPRRSPVEYQPPPRSYQPPVYLPPPPLPPPPAYPPPPSFYGKPDLKDDAHPSDAE